MLPIKFATCNHTNYNKLAAAAPQQQTNSFKKQMKKCKNPFEDIVLPCTLGEWMILRFAQSRNKSLFLTPQQVEEIVELKQNKHLDKQSLRKFYKILSAANDINLQSMQVLKPVQFLKQALYNAYQRNCGNATHFCKFTIYKNGISRIEGLDSEKQQASHDYKSFNFLQGCGDINNDNIQWGCKNDSIKLEPYKYDLTTIDTQDIKKIKEMYELYEEGLKNIKLVYEKKRSRVPKKYWYAGLKPNAKCGYQNLKNQKHKNDFQSTTIDNDKRRVSQIIGTHQNKSSDPPSDDIQVEDS